MLSRRLFAGRALLRGFGTGSAATPQEWDDIMQHIMVAAPTSSSSPPTASPELLEHVCSTGMEYFDRHLSGGYRRLESDIEASTYPNSIVQNADELDRIATSRQSKMWRRSLLVYKLLEARRCYAPATGL